MKINSKVFLSFVEKATLNGTIGSMVLNVSSSGIKCQQKDLSNISLTVAELSCQGEEMVLPVKDTNLLINMLKGFTGDISIEKNLTLIH